MNIKVDRNKLVAALLKRKSQAETEHVAALRKLPAAQQQYKADVVKVLLRALAIVQKTKSVDEIVAMLDRYNRQLLQFPEAPDKPKEPNIKHYDELLRKLALATEDTIVLTDRSEYLQYV